MLSIYLPISFVMIISSTFSLHSMKRIILMLQQLIQIASSPACHFLFLRIFHEFPKEI
jgi:hypothetical protein